MTTGAPSSPSAGVPSLSAPREACSSPASGEFSDFSRESVLGAGFSGVDDCAVCGAFSDGSLTAALCLSLPSPPKIRTTAATASATIKGSPTIRGQARFPPSPPGLLFVADSTHLQVERMGTHNHEYCYKSGRSIMHPPGDPTHHLGPAMATQGPCLLLRRCNASYSRLCEASCTRTEPHVPDNEG